MRAEAPLDSLVSEKLGTCACVQQDLSVSSRRMPRLVQEDAERAGVSVKDSGHISVVSSEDSGGGLYDDRERLGRNRRRQCTNVSEHRAFPR